MTIVTALAPVWGIISLMMLPRIGRQAHLASQLRIQLSGRVLAAPGPEFIPSTTDKTNKMKKTWLLQGVPFKLPECRNFFCVLVTSFSPYIHLEQSLACGSTQYTVSVEWTVHWNTFPCFCLQRSHIPLSVGHKVCNPQWVLWMLTVYTTLFGI